MLQKLLATFKQHSTPLLVIGGCVALLSFFALAATGLHRGSTIAKPISLTLDTASTTLSQNITVARISRGLATFPVIEESPNKWRTRDWTAGLLITAPAQAFASTTSLTVQIGDEVRVYRQTELTSLLTEDTSGSVSLTLQHPDLTTQSPSSLQFFSTLINWPGDIVVLGRLIVNYGPIALLAGVAAAGITLLYLLLVTVYPVAHGVSRTEQNKRNKCTLLIFMVLLSLASVTHFVSQGATAVDWPAFDMGPFFERAADPTFLPNDFFTEASSQPNPRFVFGYLVIGLTKLCATDWYSVFYFLKVLIVVATPPLLLLALNSFFRFVRDEKRRAVIQAGIFVGVLASLSGFVTGFFAIALWNPHMLSASAHGYAFLCGLIAMVLANYEWWRLSHGAWCITALLHPAIGLCLFGLFLILHLHHWSWRRYLPYVGSAVVVPFAVLAYLFPTTGAPLTALAFVNEYILQNHAFHYFPMHFIRAGGSYLPWEVNFGLVNILLLASALIGYLRRDRFLLISGIAAFLCYSGVILISYVFVELYPIKLLAVLGPSRFTMMGYWLVTGIYSYLLSQYLILYTPFLLGRAFASPATLRRVTIGGLCALTIITSIYYKDTPRETWREQEQPLVNWIDRKTNPGAVFVSNLFDLNIRLPLFARRAVFSGNGFPFREDSFTLFNDRRAQVFGTHADWVAAGSFTQGAGTSNFFRSRTPDDFYRLSQVYPLNYVIIEQDFSAQFAGFTPEYRDEHIIIYNVRLFKPL